MLAVISDGPGACRALPFLGGVLAVLSAGDFAEPVLHNFRSMFSDGGYWPLDSTGRLRKPGRGRWLCYAIALHDGLSRHAVPVVPGLVQVQYRRKTGVAALEQLAPFIPRLLYKGSREA